MEKITTLWTGVVNDDKFIKSETDVACFYSVLVTRHLLVDSKNLFFVNSVDGNEHSFRFLV